MLFMAAISPWQPYHPAAQDMLSTEAKQGWAWSVPEWETSSWFIQGLEKYRVWFKYLPGLENMEKRKQTMENYVFPDFWPY